MAAIADDEDFLEHDPLLDEEAFLAAVADVEAQHLGRLTNVLSYDNSRFTGGCFGGKVVDNNGSVKRSSQWEEKNVNERPGQTFRGAFDSPGDYSVDDSRKRMRIEDATRTNSLSSNSGQGIVGRSGAYKQADSQPEGEYMAALRGSNSELWQASAGGRGVIPNFPNTGGNPALGGIVRTGGGAGTCFKCGVEGHWAKDCTGGKAANGHETPDVPERFCACGGGACIVLTANTEKNQGRSFYRCPLRKDEGQCTFFEWCDAGGQSTSTERVNWAPQQPVLECQCGGGPCATLTAKTEKNMGRQFYKCPKPQGCSFFQWCDEVGGDRGGSSSSTAIRATNYPGNSSSTPMRATNYSGNSPSTQIRAHLGNVASPNRVGCYKCGQEGHWSRDCPNPQQQYSGSLGGQSQFSTKSTPEGRNTGNCYKCGGEGHWSNSCPNPGVPGGQAYVKQAGGASASGHCFKCGDPGHWANRCPTAIGVRR